MRYLVLDVVSEAALIAAMGAANARVAMGVPALAAVDPNTLQLWVIDGYASDLVAAQLSFGGGAYQGRCVFSRTAGSNSLPSLLSPVTSYLGLGAPGIIQVDWDTVDSQGRFNATFNALSLGGGGVIIRVTLVLTPAFMGVQIGPDVTTPVTGFQAGDYVIAVNWGGLGFTSVDPTESLLASVYPTLAGAATEEGPLAFKNITSNAGSLAGDEMTAYAAGDPPWSPANSPNNGRYGIDPEQCKVVDGVSVSLHVPSGNPLFAFGGGGDVRVQVAALRGATVQNVSTVTP